VFCDLLERFLANIPNSRYRDREVFDVTTLSRIRGLIRGACLPFQRLETTLRAGGNGNRQNGLGGEPPFGRTRRRVNTTPTATTAIEIPASSAYPSGAGRPRNEGGGDEAATTWNWMLDVVWVREPLVPVTVTA